MNLLKIFSLKNKLLFYYDHSHFFLIFITFSWTFFYVPGGARQIFHPFLSGGGTFKVLLSKCHLRYLTHKNITFSVRFSLLKFRKIFWFWCKGRITPVSDPPFRNQYWKTIIFYVNWYFIQSQEDLSPQLFQITSFCSPFWEDNLKIILYWFQPITSKFYFFEKIKILLVSPDYNKISAVSKSVKSEMFTEKRIIFKYCCSLQLVELLVVVIISITDSHVWGWVWVDEKVELDYMNYSVKIGDFGEF